jgi:hypothetical protein
MILSSEAHREMSLNVVLMFVFSWLDPGDPGCASMRILPQLKRDCKKVEETFFQIPHQMIGYLDLFESADRCPGISE